MHISKMHSNFQKMLMVFKIIAFEIKPLISDVYEKKACERPSTC